MGGPLRADYPDPTSPPTDPNWPVEPEADLSPEECEPTERERGAWWRGFALGLTLLLSVGLLAAVGLFLASGAPPRAAVLLVGVDERPDEQQRGQFGHTDTIAVLALPAAGGAALVSFPRDLWVDIPDVGPQRLNVAYPVGAQRGGAADGAALLQRTLARGFGLQADRWATIDFRGFVALVDALGGVDLTVPRTIVDETYPTDDYGIRRLEIRAGAQHMNGEQALAYVRTRAPDSDFGRMARQQQLLLALREQALSPAGFVRWPAVALALPRAVQTNLGVGEALAIVRVLLLQPRDHVRALVIGPELAPPQVGPGGAAILMPREAAIRQAIAETLDPPRRTVNRQ